MAGKERIVGLVPSCCATEDCCKEDIDEVLELYECTNDSFVARRSLTALRSRFHVDGA